MSSDRAVKMAEIILQTRRDRGGLLPPELFGDPAWDLLLELFVADGKGERLTGFDVSHRCKISPAVLSRWLRAISERGLVVGDGQGDLSDEITLSGSGMEGLERLMGQAAASHSALIIS